MKRDNSQIVDLLFAEGRRSPCRCGRCYALATREEISNELMHWRAVWRNLLGEVSGVEETIAELERQLAAAPEVETK